MHGDKLSSRNLACLAARVFYAPRGKAKCPVMKKRNEQNASLNAIELFMTLRAPMDDHCHVPAKHE